MTLSEILRNNIRNIPDFPTKGIQFKDITTLLKNPTINQQIIDAFSAHVERLKVDVLVGIESRGFMFGMALAVHQQIPFVPIRKKGKLPYQTVEAAYELEYGSAVIEMHVDAISKHDRVYIHDDILATGGTALAAAKLVRQLKGDVVGFGFLAEFSSLNGRDTIGHLSDEIYSLVNY